MSKPDKQFYILRGDDKGTIWLKQFVQQESGPAYIESVLFSAGDYSKPRVHVIPFDLVPPDASFADTLKVSGVVDLEIHARSITGGYEDCIDINHSRGVTLFVDQVIPKGRFIATIKGGSADIDLTVHEQVGHGSETDYDLGNWSDQGHERTKGIKLFVGTQDGSPATCRVLHAWNPTVNDTFQKWKINGRWRGIFWWFMDKLKRLNWA
jgi:hypothetical protein